MSQILFRNINLNRIDKINRDVTKIETYKDPIALEKFRKKNKKK